MSDSSHTRASLRARSIQRDTSNRGRRRAVVWLIVGLIVLLLIAVASLAGVAVSKALAVRDRLAPAVPIATALPGQIIAGDLSGAAAEASKLEQLSDDAVSETQGLEWRVAEWIPFVGPNLFAVRASAEAVAEIAAFATTSIPDMDLASFRPVAGAIDLGAVDRLGSVLTRGSATFDAVASKIESVDQAFLLPEVADALSTLDGAVTTVDEALISLTPMVNALPAALGQGGSRTYLLMFQGNSELRASGGNPAALALVTATDGRIELTTQATSVQFANARPESIAPLDPETEHLYSDIIGRWIPNMTATPDFPTTVEILRAWWEDEGLPPFDDVISTDPIALSYILRATGPVPLPTGEVLTSENAVSLLLNEVYFDYGEGNGGTEQDLFFAAAAAQIFSTLTTGISNPLGFADALKQASDEGRMKIWSSNPDIESLVSGTKLSGTLPATNEARTVAGVYFNDTTGAKTDYYADASVVASTDQCSATGVPTFTQTITFANNITTAQAAELPYFITGPHYPAGHIVTDVVVYSPVGASIESWTVDGAQSATLVSEGSHLGRSAIRISMLTTPQTAATVNVVMKGAAGTTGTDYGPYDVWTTPMVRDTPVTLEAPGCG